jgi:hypothetical protein
MMIIRKKKKKKRRSTTDGLSQGEDGYGGWGEGGCFFDFDADVFFSFRLPLTHFNA